MRSFTVVADARKLEPLFHTLVFKDVFGATSQHYVLFNDYTTVRKLKGSIEYNYDRDETEFHYDRNLTENMSAAEMADALPSESRAELDTFLEGERKYHLGALKNIMALRSTLVKLRSALDKNDQ